MRWISVLTIISILFVVVTSNTENGCHTVKAFIESAFYLNIGQQMRGADEYFLGYFYQASIKSLINILKNKTFSHNTIFGDICLEFSDLNQLKMDTSAILFFPPENQTIKNDDAVAVPLTSSETSMSLNTDLDVNENLTWTKPVGLSSADVISSSFYKESFETMGVQSAIHGLQKLHSNPLFYGDIFYMPETIYHNDQLVELSNNSKNASQTVWETVENLLNYSFNDVGTALVPSLAKLPRTIDLFCDPFRTMVEESYTRQSKFGQTISGYDLVSTVSAMVLRLYMAGVPEHESMTILNHTVLYLFSAMRAKRIDGLLLNVTDIFVPFYDQRFRTLTEGLDLSTVPDISLDRMKEVYGQEMMALLNFSNHGRLESKVIATNGTYYIVPFKEVLFSSLRIWLLLTGSPSQNPTPSQESTPTGWSSWISGRLGFEWRSIAWWNGDDDDDSDVNETNANGLVDVTRTETTCDSPYEYVAHNDTSWIVHDSQYCCARICLDLDQIIPVGIASTAVCCQQCNAYDCPMDNGESIAQLLVVMVQSYGWYNSSTAILVF